MSDSHEQGLEVLKTRIGKRNLPKFRKTVRDVIERADKFPTPRLELPSLDIVEGSEWKETVQKEVAFLLSLSQIRRNSLAEIENGDIPDDLPARIPEDTTLRRHLTIVERAFENHRLAFLSKMFFSLIEGHPSDFAFEENSLIREEDFKTEVSLLETEISFSNEDVIGIEQEIEFIERNVQEGGNALEKEKLLFLIHLKKMINLQREEVIDTLLLYLSLFSRERRFDPLTLAGEYIYIWEQLFSRAVAQEGEVTFRELKESYALKKRSTLFDVEKFIFICRFKSIHHEILYKCCLFKSHNSTIQEERYSSLVAIREVLLSATSLKKRD